MFWEQSSVHPSEGAAGPSVPVQVLWDGSEEQHPLGLPSSQEYALKLLEWECGDSLRSFCLFQPSHALQVWGGMERGIGASQIFLPWSGKSWGEEF